MKIILLSTVAGVVLLAASSCGDDDQAVTEKPVKQNVKVILAGTNDAKEPVTDGGIVGEGTFRATGAINDSGPVRAYRAEPSKDLILVRYVAKGTKGTITHRIGVGQNRGTPAPKPPTASQR